MKTKVYEFLAEIKIIGINPYVSIPESILKSIFEDANKNKGAIQIKGEVNKKPYLQNLVKYAGEWRLYINMLMLDNSPKRIGEEIKLTISFDPRERIIQMHPLLKEAIDKNENAKLVFEKLAPSIKKEIVRYISQLKTHEAIVANVAKAIDFLLGKGRFIGREKP